MVVGTTVGVSAPLIRFVSTPAYKRVAVETTDGNRYEADLSSFSGVFCFPRTAEEWARVSIDSYGLDLVWATRFEVHVDQIIGLADRVEPAGASSVTAAPAS